MENTSNFTEAELVELIWSSRNKSTFSTKKKDMLDMNIESLLALAEENNISLEPVESVAPVELVANGITPRTTLNGTIVYTTNLPLVHTDGYSFHFEFGDKKVVIAGDLQLSDCFEAGTIKLGDMVPFHYTGVDSFKLLSTNGSYLVPNNNQEFPSRGTVAKSFCEPIQALLEIDKAKKAKANLELLRIAKDNGLKVREVRNIDREDRVADARTALKALRANK
jgi:hypothetical protein